MPAAATRAATRIPPEELALPGGTLRRGGDGPAPRAGPDPPRAERRRVLGRADRRPGPAARARPNRTRGPTRSSRPTPPPGAGWPPTSAPGWAPSARAGCASAATCTSGWASWPPPTARPSPGACASSACTHGPGAACPPSARAEATRCSACTGSAARRPRSSPPWPPCRTPTAWWPSTSRASASRTSRSGRPTTPPGLPGWPSKRWTRSGSSGPTWWATAWAAGWPSRPA